MSCATCPNCDAELPASEIADGWCETCGKRLPGLVAMAGGRAVGSQSRTRRKRSGTKNITFGGVVVLTICMAVSLAVAMITMGKGPIPTGIGCGVGAVFGVLIGRAMGLMPTPDE
jgi:hypothetical protein